MGIVDFVTRTGDKTIYTFTKGIKLTVKPKKNNNKDNETKEINVATEISKITIRKGGDSINLLEPTEWREEGKTSKKRSFGKGTRVTIHT